MLLLLLTAAVSTNATAVCKLNLGRGEAVVERRILKVHNETLQAFAVSKSDERYGDPESRMVVLGSPCNVIFTQQFDDATKVLFSGARLGEQPILFVTAFRPGGSGAGFTHLLLAYGGNLWPEDNVESLAPTSLNQGNMDGIFVGDLGRRRGPGLVMWNAQWDGQEAHYEPHHYEIVTYRWRNGRFVGPDVRTTKRKYDPGDPNQVARRVGLGVHDMTEQNRFGWR
jgi:hypothetical protein